MLAVIMAQRGCYVSGIDVAQPMLRQAERRVREANLSDLVDLQELGVADLDVAFPDAHFDAIVSTLVFSELSDDEISYTLAHCWRILKPGGQLLLADEVLPDSVAGRWATFLFRLPFKLLAFVLTQSTTHRVASLPDRIKAAGFVMHSVTRYLGGTLRLFVATVATAPEASSWEERPPSQEAGSGCQAC
jgi:demethylmenaquinone methyltransferase/2-methoxy-6-polyprenyl-1,4-benzoquinol methylase